MIRSLSYEDIYYDIRKNVSYEDFYKGRNYFSPYIEYLGSKEVDRNILHKFKVESERTTKKYDCSALMNRKGHIVSLKCSCPQFKNYDSCKHIAACLLEYADDIFQIILEDADIEEITTSLFNENKLELGNIKKEIKLNVLIDTDSNNFGFEIGLDKLYKCTGSKLNNFLDSYNNNQEYIFGKNYTFNLKEQYFKEEDNKIIEYFNTLKDINSLRNSSIINPLIDMCNTNNLHVNGYKINKIETGFPLKTSLKEENGKYVLKLDNIENINFLNNDYVQDKNILYKLDNKSKKLIDSIQSNNLSKLIFAKKDLDKFSNSILPIIKKEIEVDNSIKDLVISKEPTTRLYFDIYRDKIICNLKFVYDSLEIEYGKSDNNVLRDREYEQKVIQDLIKNHFVIGETIYLADLEDMVNFLEEGLTELSKKYEVYTSEKLKGMKVINKTSVTSTFSIGQDNIMSYNFSLDNIKDSEIVNILSSLKKNKKYFKLKSGDIINLEDDNLQELKHLSEDLNLEDFKGEIPKYQAIYLDSLKKDYHIIKTNNLFDELITKFNAYKDSKLHLSKDDQSILRNYQVDGVKWLYNIQKTGFGGVLADEMGLGKSLQTICFFKELLKEDKNAKFLIVAPTSLVYNWEQEFMKFAPNLKYQVLVGTKIKREELKNHLENTNIYITSYGLLREDKDFYLDNFFKVMVIDEAQNIKNNQAGITKVVKSIKAETKIALTGTPIENSISELWSIFDYIMPGFLNNQKNFESRYKITDFEQDGEKLDVLAKLINPFILRRKKKDVILDLPDKIENNIYVDLTDEQKKIYVAELERVNKEMEEIMANEGIEKARFMILQLLTKLRQICISPSIIYNNYEGGSAKLEEFVKVIKESTDNGHKVLVFTSFKTALELARNKLKEEGVTSYVIDGSVSAKKRMELVNDFNNNDTNVFFLMLKSGGTGLNLTAADVVIHLDLWWNPQAENQATDRAHRIGQKNVVQVIKIITKGTIEEKILELQEKKKILSDKLIDANTGNNSFSKLTEKDIKNLLSFENSELA